MKKKIISILIIIALVAAAAAALWYKFVYIGDGSFTDLEKGAVYADAVYYCADNDLIKETSHRKFSPNEDAAVKTLLRALWVHDGRPVSGQADESGKAYEYDMARSFCNVCGIYDGDDEIKLDGVTLASVIYEYNLYRLEREPRYDTSVLNDFDDYGDSEVWKNYSAELSFAVEYGILKPESTSLCPTASITRAQLSQSLYTYFKLNLLTPGIDISAYQKGITGEGMKALDNDFVFIRMYRQNGGATVNGVENIDECFEEYYNSAKTSGLRVGAYWFMYATNVAEAKAEAEQCVKVLQGREWDLPVVLDFEEAGIEYMQKQGVVPTKELVSDMVDSFCKIISSAGYTPMIYSNLNMCYYMNGSGYISDEVLSKYDTWVASWLSNDPLSLSDILKARSGVIGQPDENYNTLYKNAKFWQIGYVDGSYFGMEDGRSVDIDLEIKR